MQALVQTSGDQYIIPSMKDQERRRRGYDTSDSHVLRASLAIQKTPKRFRRFLSWKNKKSLSVYLFTYWSTVCVSELQNISCVCYKWRELSFAVTVSAAVIRCLLLYSRLKNFTVTMKRLTHACYCMQSMHQGLMIMSSYRESDTDLFYLNLSFRHSFCSKFFLAV